MCRCTISRTQRFWEYMGMKAKKVKYKQNLDFSLDHIENNSIDFVLVMMFSVIYHNLEWKLT